MNLLLVLACAVQPQLDAEVAQSAGAATPMASLPSKPQATPQAEVELELPPAPAGTAQVQPLLLAHHTQDLPGRAAIDTHGEGAEILAWLVDYDPAMVVRERALMLLAQYDAVDFCGEQLQSEEPKLRAAAVSCLSGRELPEELSEAMTGALEDEDPRVRDAAQKAAAAQP